MPASCPFPLSPRPSFSKSASQNIPALFLHYLSLLRELLATFLAGHYQTPKFKDIIIISNLNYLYFRQHGNSMSSTRPGSSGARTKLVKEITNLAKDRISPPPSPALLQDDIPEEVCSRLTSFL